MLREARRHVGGLLAIGTAMILLATLPTVSAAPLVSLDQPEAVSVEQNSNFTVEVTAHNRGSNSVDLEIKAKRPLPDGFSLVEGSGVKFLDPIDTESFDMVFRVGEVEPGNYTIRLYDLAPGDQESPVDLTVRVSAAETPTPVLTETATETATEEPVTETPTETEAEPSPTAPGEETSTTPGFGLAAGLAALAGSRRFL